MTQLNEVSRAIKEQFLTIFPLSASQEFRPIKCINSRSYATSRFRGLVEMRLNWADTVSSFIWASESRPQQTARLCKSPSLKWLLYKTAALCHPECQAWLKQYITRARELPNCKDKWHCFETTERKTDSDTRNKKRAEDRTGEEKLSVHQEQFGCSHTRASAADPSSFDVTIWMV